MSGKIVKLGVRRNDLDKLVIAVKDVLYSKPDNPVNFVEALGVLELVKMELFAEMQRGNDD